MKEEKKKETRVEEITGEETDISKADELIEETSDKEKAVFDKEPFWAQWCPICREATPYFFDPVGYVCNECGKTVCAKCIYPYEGKLVCQNCLKKLPEDERAKLHPLFSQKVHFKSKSRVNFLRLLFFVGLMTVFIGVSSFLINMIMISLFAFTIGSILMFILIIYFIYSYEKEAKNLYQ